MDARSPHSEMGNVEWAMLLGLSVLWGGSYFFYAVLTAALPPLTVVLGRVGIAAIFLHLALAVTRRPMPWRAPWGAFAVMGMLNNVIPFTLVAFGVTQISSSLAAILNATTPLFTVLTAHILTNETLTPAKALGVLCGVLGVVVLIGPAALADLGSGDVLGQIC
jgi:drug/metabolite transporter (DMT)-like permease